MIRLILMLILVWTNFAHAKEKDCEWDNNVPCITISKSINNSNALGDKITPTHTIKKSEIQKYGLIDLPKVLTYIGGLDITQSGPTGQQASLFLRGTNSNQTLVLLNGIPINDFSTPTGAHDFGQDFMFNVVQIDVYKGSQGAHWGADAVGGAINFRTTVDYDQRLSLSGNGNDKTISGNFYTKFNEFDISVSAGEHQSRNVSALSGADEKDGTRNQTIGVNVSKWYDLIHWRTTWFARNTFSDIDGHSVALQDGYYADNTFFALQTGIDYLNNSLTFHTHEYDRDYYRADYESENYTIRGTHQTEKYGFGFDYKHNEAIGKYTNIHQRHNLGYFFNFSHNIFSYHHRFDEEHETYKLGFFKELDAGLSISGSTSTSYRDETSYTSIEYGDSQELTLTKNNFATTIFKNDIGNLNSDGVEFSYKQDNSKFFISHLNSKTNDSVNLRRPNWALGFMHTKDLKNNFSITTNYKYKGKHLDVHNVTYESGISMPETHLLDLNIGYNYHGIDFGISLLNLFDEDYESPHGFSQEGRKFTLGFNKSF